MRKICTTLKLWSGQEPISCHPCTLVTKYEDIIDQKEVLSIVILQGTFLIFQKKKRLAFWRVQNFECPKNIHPKKTCTKNAHYISPVVCKKNECILYGLHFFLPVHKSWISGCVFDAFLKTPHQGERLSVSKKCHIPGGGTAAAEEAEAGGGGCGAGAAGLACQDVQKETFQIGVHRVIDWCLNYWG